jgi:DNA-binding HxlR family transcriptional regulator
MAAASRPAAARAAAPRANIQPAAGAAARRARRTAPDAREAAAAGPEGNRRQTNFCPVYDAILVLQGKWTLHIVSALLHGPRGFNELARAIGGCNPATLAERLDTLERLGLLDKTVESTMPPRTSYALTRAGAALEEVITSIDRWGQRHLKPELVRSVTAARGRRAGPSARPGAAKGRALLQE